MQNLFTSQSLAGMTYYILCTTTKNGGKLPRGIYNIGCKLPITYPYNHRHSIDIHFDIIHKNLPHKR